MLKTPASLKYQAVTTKQTKTLTDMGFLRCKLHLLLR